MASTSRNSTSGWCRPASSRRPSDSFLAEATTSRRFLAPENKKPSSARGLFVMCNDLGSVGLKEFVAPASGAGRFHFHLFFRSGNVLIGTVQVQTKIGRSLKRRLQSIRQILVFIGSGHIQSPDRSEEHTSELQSRQH